MGVVLSLFWLMVAIPVTADEGGRSVLPVTAVTPRLLPCLCAHHSYAGTYREHGACPPAFWFLPEDELFYTDLLFGNWF